MLHPSNNGKIAANRLSTESKKREDAITELLSVTFKMAGKCGEGLVIGGEMPQSC